LNKIRNSTEELQWKQDRYLEPKKKKQKKEINFNNEIQLEPRTTKGETRIEILKAKKGNVADLLMQCLF